MNQEHTHQTALNLTLAIVGLAAALLMSGCTNHKVSSVDSKKLRRVHEADFLDTNAQAAAPTTPRASTPDQGGQTKQSLGDPITLSSPNFNTRPNTSNPIIEINSNELILLDAKVGDINGHPIYINEFFAPIEDLLIAEGSRENNANWGRIAGRTIATRLDGIIADELLRAEALASLSQQQRLGLRSFLKGFRNDLLSKNLGSSELANQRILEEQGMTLEESLRRQEADTLIRSTLYREINRRVNVSWRDIKQRYERDIEKYIPPPTANFRRIRVFTSDADKVAEVVKMFEGGESFKKIARSKLNTFKPDEGGLESFPIKETYATTKFYGLDILNEHAWSLSEGEQAGPFEAGASTYWIKLRNIEHEAVSLYDAQLTIQSQITNERRQTEQREYLERLLSRAHYSSRDDLLIELITVAEQRYLPKQ
ncbi:MAG: hypothetical protein JKY96_05740 [Phycisphaerales bacterium]|nr:hypothetical protein [Phycisphaerales bacterium]